MSPVNVVEERREFGHHFQTELLESPIQVGASLRRYRLWDNGKPAAGGQWHATLEFARARADYVLQHSYVDRIVWLENRVRALENRLAAGN